MTAQLAPAPVFRSWDNLGLPLVGGKLFTYAAGTTNLQATYVDSTQNTQNTNPIILNFRGEAFVWLNPLLSYKFVLQDAFGNLIWTEDNIQGGINLNSNLTPSQTNTFTLGTPTLTWANAYFGPNGAPVFDPVSGNIGFYPTTAAETAASVTPTAFSYPPLDIRRYGGDPAGSADSTAAFNKLISVMLQLGGASTIIWPGTYKISSTITANLAPNSGPTAATYGLSFYAHGVILNYSGTGYAFDFFATNTSALFGFPILQVYGAKLIGTISATGGWRTRTLSAVRWSECDVQGFTAGPAWTMLNDVAWSENCHWRGCGAVNCQSIIAFQRTAGTNSFARTYVDGMFGAGISNYWFDVGGTIPGVGASASVSLYDSRFAHVSGNFTSLALFGIGNSTNAADMTASVIDGLDYEINALPPSTWTAGLSAGATTATLASGWPYPSGTYTVFFSDGENRQAVYTNGLTSVSWAGGLSNNVTTSAVLQQAVIQLRDYPQNAGVARRPVITNIGSLALFNGVSNNPVWISNTGTSLTGPEAAQIQYFAGSPIFAEWGQSQVYEPNFSQAAVRNLGTYDSQQATCSVTGCTAAVTGAVNFYRCGNLCFALVAASLTGTSNSTSMTMTGVPAEFQPASNGVCPCYVTNSGAVTAGLASITGGTITFFVATAVNAYSTVGFTNTGTKGLTAGTLFFWPLT